MIIKLILITLVAVVGKLIENSNKFKRIGCNIFEGNIHSFYECLNVHLILCMGILGLVWASRIETGTVLPLFLFTICGSASKGIFSNHKPDRLNLQDRDALWGLYVPNGFALAAVIYGLIIITIDGGNQW